MSYRPVTYMQWCDAFFILVLGVKLSTFEQFLYSADFSQSCELHYIILNRELRLYGPNILEFDILICAQLRWCWCSFSVRA